MIKCHVCQREAGPDMVACPQRPAGNCPYRLYNSLAVQARVLWMSAGLGLLLVAGGLVVGGLGLILVWMGAFALAAALYVSSSRRTVLHDPATGRLWHEQRLLGRVSWRFVVTEARPILPDFAWQEPLTYPAAVGAAWAALKDAQAQGQAGRQAGVTVVKAMLLDLLVADVLQLWHLEALAARGTTGAWHPRQTTKQYIARPGSQPPPDALIAPMRGMVAALGEKPPGRLHLGLTISTLVSSALPDQSPDPFEEIVAQVLHASGLAPDAFAADAALAADAEVVATALHQLDTAWPGLEAAIVEGLSWQQVSV